MSTQKPFFSPKLAGPRFNDHSLPVSILEDFSALEELIFELAKKEYLLKNPDRKRVPKGFTENVYLKLSELEEGSTIPKILIAVATSLTTPTIPSDNSEYFRYFESARDKVFDLVEDANKGKSPDIDSKYLNYFNRIGKNLKEGEVIDLLNSADSERDVKLTRNTRRKILLSRSERLEYSETIRENVLISSIDKKNRKFTIEWNGNTYDHDFIDEFSDSINQAFHEYEHRTLVSLTATGIFNSDSRLVMIEDIETMDILDPFDVAVRLTDLSKLEQGWFDGRNGKPLSKVDLDVFEFYFMSYYRSDLKLPAIFPTIEGNIVLEWKKNNVEVSLEVELKTLQADLFFFDMEDDNSDYEEKLDLDSDTSWETLNSLIERHIA